MSRFALLVPLVVVGCSVPTPVGELQQVVAGSSATSTTDDPNPNEDSESSASSSSSTSSGAIDTSTSSDSGSGSSSGNAIVAEPTSFVIRRGDLPPDEPTGTGDTAGSDVGTGPDGDPDDLLVTIGVTTASCQDPFASDPCQTWTATLVFTPEQQVTGTYTDAEVDGFYVEQDMAEGDRRCPGTGGSLSGFTIILESIDETGLELVFEGDGLGPDNVDLNGMSFSVPRC